MRTTWWAAVVLCALVVTPASAWAQLTLPPGTPLIPSAPETTAGTGARRGPITVTPSISVLGEYNDNIFQSNANKESDFILGFVPGISVTLESPIYRLLGSYSFTAEIYADHSELNDAFARHNFLFDGRYRVTPLLTLSLTDSLIVANNSNTVAAENISTGRTRSFSNTLAPGVAYQLNPRTALRGRAAWTALRYDSDLALD
jgi:uncharacterized protein (PEP-CTERM system associated)